MNHKKMLFPLLLTSLSCFAQHAQPNKKTESGSATPTGIYVGVGIYRFHYEETVQKAFFVSDKGPMRHVDLSFAAPSRWDNVFWDLRATLASGDLDYVGSGTTEGVDHKMTKLDFIIRHDMPVTDSVTFSPFYGAGYRLFIDNGQDTITSTGYYGYNRKSEYHYFPVGLRAQMRVGAHVVLMPSLQWNALYRGRQTSDYDIVNNQYLGYGYELGLSSAIAMGNGDMVISATYKKWSIADSSVISSQFGNRVVMIDEPENTTTELGATVGYRF